MYQFHYSSGIVSHSPDTRGAGQWWWTCSPICNPIWVPEAAGAKLHRAELACSNLHSELSISCSRSLAVDHKVPLVGCRCAFKLLWILELQRSSSDHLLLASWVLSPSLQVCPLERVLQQKQAAMAVTAFRFSAFLLVCYIGNYRIGYWSELETVASMMHVH